MSRNKQIDGLRGITIILILIFHVFCRYNEIYMAESGLPVRWLGTYGNTIFLLISSYYLTNENKEKVKIGQCYVNKVLRLWPCYAVSITVVWCVVHIFELPGRMSSVGDYFLNLVFLNGFIGTPYVDGAHWYITTLLAATLVMGIVKYLGVEDKPVTYLVLLVAEGVCKVLNLHVLDMLLCSSYIGLICLGICIRKMHLKGYILSTMLSVNIGPVKYLKKNAWFCTAVICVAYHLARRGLTSVLCLLGALPIFLLVIHKKFKLLETQIPQMLGKISYPIYLIHQNIAYTIIYNLTKVMGQFSQMWSLIACCVAVVSGLGLYCFIEKPTQKLISRKRQ